MHSVPENSHSLRRFKRLNLHGTNGRVSGTNGTTMKNALLILLLLTPALFADKKPKRNVPLWDSSPTGIKTDVNGHMQVENSGIVPVWAESWPPPKTEDNNEANVLIVKTLNSAISSGKIKLKKPPLTLEQRAERVKLPLQTGAGFIGGSSSNSPKEKPPKKSDR